MKRLFIFLLTILVTVPSITLAQNNFLVGIPGVTQGESTNFDQYIQAVYVMFISIAALLAVVKIIIAGVKYMFTDIVTQKGEAKKDIQGAVFGLLIVLSAVLILTVINPELTRFNFEQEGVRLQESSGQQGANNQQNNPTTGLSYEDVTTILDYCGDEQNSGNCIQQGCNGILSDTFIGSLNVGCRVVCDALSGEIVNGDICVYSEEYNQEDVVNDLIDECEEDCAPVDCPFFRTELSCQSWCENRGGISVNTSFILNNTQCIIPNVDPSTEILQLECDNGDCTRAEFICTSSEGIAEEVFVSPGVGYVNCTTSEERNLEQGDTYLVPCDNNETGLGCNVTECYESSHIAEEISYPEINQSGIPTGNQIRFLSCEVR